MAIPNFLKTANGPPPEVKQFAPKAPQLPKRDPETVISDAIQHVLGEAANVIVSSANELVEEILEAQSEAKTLASNIKEMGDLQSQKIRELTSRVVAIKLAVANSAKTVAEYLPAQTAALDNAAANLEAALRTTRDDEPAEIISDPKESER